MYQRLFTLATSTLSLQTLYRSAHQNTIDITLFQAHNLSSVGRRFYDEFIRTKICFKHSVVMPEQMENFPYARLSELMRQVEVQLRRSGAATYSYEIPTLYEERIETNYSRGNTTPPNTPPKRSNKSGKTFSSSPVTATTPPRIAIVGSPTNRSPLKNGYRIPAPRSAGISSVAAIM
jgi:hypothetical protein